MTDDLVDRVARMVYEGVVVMASHHPWDGPLGESRGRCVATARAILALLTGPRQP